MAVQDLTPQLRTRLSRVERVVGVFVTIASLLLMFGFGYYVYHTGENKGWWKAKANYHTFVESGAGLNVGDRVILLGFPVGEITQITAMEPFSAYGAVYLEFYVMYPYMGYIWTDSEVKVSAGDFLGKRNLEIIPGGISLKTNPKAELHATYKMNGDKLDGVYNDKTGVYEPLEKHPKGYTLPARESPAVTQQLEVVANQVQEALPGILDLTNRLNLVLSNAAGMAGEAQATLASLGPTLSNVSVITENLKQPKGSLGDWILPTNLNAQLVQTLATAGVTLTNVNNTVVNTDSNVTTLATSLDLTLINLANLTSNLNAQVQSNTNLVKSISDLIVNADDMVQGLKRHWLLRSAFKNKPEDKKEEEEKKNEPRSERTPPPRAGKWRQFP